MRIHEFLILLLLATLPMAALLTGEARAQTNAATPPALSAEAINSANLSTLPAEFLPPPPADETGSDDAAPPPPTPDPAIVKLQTLLDRTGASPGVIDGENVRKAVRAFEALKGLTVDGIIDQDLLADLDDGTPVAGLYTVTAEDVAAIVAPIPDDYALMAERDFLGYSGVPELLAERFHMDEKLVLALNPDAAFAEGEGIVVVAPGLATTGMVARIEADKTLRQVRAYDADDNLVAAYPATIGSESNPSPSGTHVVAAVAPMPNYTYNPEVNFQQGENTETLIIPPGPNGPVGSMWIDLTEPTFGIHGTPEPSKIDKTGSHGCVRLTNWDAEELAAMVEVGVPVAFLD